MATVGVFAMIFDDQERLLCVRLNYAHRGWTTPGGRVDAGEAPLEALRREVFEETGFKVEPGPLIGVYAKPHEDDVVLCFEARVLTRDAWEPDHEISEVRWFLQSELPVEMTAVVRSRVDDAFARRRGEYREFNGAQAPVT